MRKNIYKLFLVTVFLTGTLFQSCETTELENTDNPNGLTTGEAQFLLNSIQSSYRGSQRTFSTISEDLTRISYMFGRNYFANYGAGTMNGPWGNLYSGMLTDIQAIEAAQTDDNDLRMHLAISKVLQAHTMMQLVDYLGDIVRLDQATQPIEFPQPELTNDNGASIYATSLTLLDEAIALFNEEPSSLGVQDLFYGNITDGSQDDDSLGKWIRLANTLKMRAAITTGDLTSFNTIVAADNFISSEDDDFVFRHGTAISPTNLQHPDYINGYTTTGANGYLSNWLMDLMLDSDDPRRRYYFYRQLECTFGASCDEEGGNGEFLSCSLQGVPTHLSGTDDAEIWCFLEDGYWGRFHGNDEGTPPDGDKRTTVGSYPAAGRFDDDSFDTVTLGQGGNGQGISPIILSSYVDFWRAEVALSQGGDASTHLRNGITNSIAKVQPFAALHDPTADLSFEPDSATVTAFIDGIMADYTTGSDAEKWNILGEQYFVALYGGGADARNFYLRTGFPIVSDNIDPAPGNFPRTFLYPSNEVIANSNITQRTNNDQAVFWNTQALPSSN